MLRAASRMRYGAATLPAAMEMRRLRGASNNAGETKKKKKASPILALMFLLTIHEETNCYRITHNQAEGSGYGIYVRIWASSLGKERKRQVCWQQPSTLL